MKFRKNIRGFGLPEALIAGSIALLVLAGIMRVFTIMTSGQKRGDIKNEVQNLDNRIKNLLSSDNTCKASLVDLLPNKVFDPADLAGFNSDPAKDAADLRLGNGEILASGTKVPEFTISELKIQILGEIAPAGSGKYEAELIMRVDTSVRGRSLAGGELAPRRIPLVLITAAVANSQPPERNITGCYGRSVSGSEACAAIGGRWIDSLQRCYFGGDLKLNQFECVSDDEFLPGHPLEGAVVQTCFYRPNGGSSLKYASYQCLDFPRDNVAKCKCLQNQATQTHNGWQVERPSDGHYYFPCDGGVVIKVPDQQTVFLSDNEFVDGKFYGAVPAGQTGQAFTATLTTDQFLENYNILDTVLECLYDPGSASRTLRCSQEDKAMLGKVGSCIFVNGSVAWETTVTNNVISQVRQDIYTGWIYVTRARTMQVIGTGATAYVAVLEAAGRKCFFVKRLAGAEVPLSSRTTSYADPVAGGPANVLADEFRYHDVKSCLFIGGSSPSNDNPYPVSAAPFRGQYLQNYPCDNSEVVSSNLTGDNDSNPSLNKGACWYFKNVRIQPGYYKNLGVTGATVAARSYTGWVYLPRDIPDEWFNTDLTGPPVNQATMQCYACGSPATCSCYHGIVGVPCNAGVRFTTDQ